MSTGHQLLTAREFEQLTFERPTELVRGEIVEQEMPTSQHGAICIAIAAILYNWSRAGKHGVVFGNDSHVLVEQDPDTVRGPDVAFIRRDRLPHSKLPPGTLEIAPDLVVEVLSPSDRWSQVESKIEEYLSAGVREVWIIDPELRTVSIQQPEQPSIRLRESDAIERQQLLPGFRCPIAELFADI
jgi:Uma2 family endonuclease